MSSTETLQKIVIGLCFCLSALSATVVCAEKFDAKSVGQSTWQSRDFEDTSAPELLHASILVIQDIGLQVTEAALEPGLLVAQSHAGGHVLTLSLIPVAGEQGNYRVRLSMAAHRSEREVRKHGRPDYGDFYQDFFTHLNREIFRGRSLN